MVGRDLKDVFPPKVSALSDREVFFLSVKFANQDRPVSLTLKEGEVLGIGGLQGQGQIKLLQAAFGLEHTEEQTIRILGKEV